MTARYVKNGRLYTCRAYRCGKRSDGKGEYLCEDGEYRILCEQHAAVTSNPPVQLALGTPQPAAVSPAQLQAALVTMAAAETSGQIPEETRAKLKTGLAERVDGAAELETVIFELELGTTEGWAQAEVLKKFLQDRAKELDDWRKTYTQPIHRLKTEYDKLFGPYIATVETLSEKLVGRMRLHFQEVEAARKAALASIATAAATGRPIDHDDVVEAHAPVAGGGKVKRWRFPEGKDWRDLPLKYLMPDHKALNEYAKTCGTGPQLDGAIEVYEDLK